MGSPTSARPWRLVAAITAAALALRVYRLDACSLWMDEAVQVSYYGAPGWLACCKLAARHAQPPLDYLIGYALYRILPQTDFVFRLPAALFGTALVPLSYLLLRRLVSPRSALAGCLLVAVSPTLVRYAQEARPYSIFYAGFVATWIVYLRAVEQRRLRDWAAFALLAALLLHSRGFLPLVVLLALNLTGLFFGWTRSCWRQAACASAAAALLFLPALLLIGRSRGAWGAGLDPSRLGRIPWTELARGFAAELGPLPALYLLPLLAALPLLGQRPFRYLVCLFGLQAALHIGLFHLVAQPGQPLVSRYLAFYALPLLWLAAAGIDHAAGASRWRFGVGLLLLLLLVAAGLPSYFSHCTKTDWRALGAHLDDSHAAGDLVVMESLRATGRYEPFLQGRGRYVRRVRDVVRLSDLTRGIDGWLTGSGRVRVVVWLEGGALEAPCSRTIEARRFTNLVLLTAGAPSAPRRNAARILLDELRRRLPPAARPDVQRVLARIAEQEKTR